MGIRAFARLAKAVIADQTAQFPKWAQILAVRPERGRFVTLDLEIHYGWTEPFTYTGPYRLPVGVMPEAGQHVAVRRISPDDADVSYAIEWGTPPRYGAPPGQHPAVRMDAARRAHDAGAISDTEYEQAQDDLRRWGRDHGGPNWPLTP